MHVAVGRIRLRADTNRLRFFWYGSLAYLQAWRAAGNIYTSVHRDDPRTFWSMSVWKSSEDMLSYRNSGSHLRIMRISETLAAHIDFQHWEAEAVPSWHAAKQRLNANSLQ